MCRPAGLNDVMNLLVFQVDAWAQSNAVPGLFTGSTGAQVLTSEELSTGGPQAWLKKVRCTHQAQLHHHSSEYWKHRVFHRLPEA